MDTQTYARLSAPVTEHRTEIPALYGLGPSGQKTEMPTAFFAKHREMPGCASFFGPICMGAHTNQKKNSSDR
jgi:hypothetical protein